MNPGTIQFFFTFGVLALMLFGTYVIGSLIERRHFADLRRREQAMRGYPVSTFEQLPDGWRADSGQLLVGNVVISLHYFKRFIAGLRTLFGGRIKTYEPLLDRARREAILRLTEQARSAGYDAVINVRIDTSRLANPDGGNGVAGIEILAFGTAIKLNQRLAAH